MVRSKFILICIFLCFIISCARVRTDLTSVKDPISTNTNIRNLVVYAAFSDIETRQEVESGIASKLSEHAIEAIPSMQILLPTRTYTKEEISSVLEKNHIDSPLTVVLTDAYSTQTYIPQISTSHGQGTISGNAIDFSSTTYHTGGFYLSKPIVRFTLKLFDLKQGSIVWIASTLTRGNAFANLNKLIDSLSSTAVEKLQEEGFIR